MIGGRFVKHSPLHPTMTRPVTLFTGQWADLPLETLSAKAAEWGYDGLVLATWGDHFDVVRALSDDAYCRGRLACIADRVAGERGS